MTALQVDRPARIDGHLSEPAWRNAETAGGFFRAQQTRGTPARSCASSTHKPRDRSTWAVSTSIRSPAPDSCGKPAGCGRRDSPAPTSNTRRRAVLWGSTTRSAVASQGVFNWLVSLDADANLFSRLTIGLTGRRFHWGAHRKTLLLRTTTNYQFTRRVGLRLFHERVIERTAGTTDDNFNTVLDYEFTPESHFFFAFVRDRNRSRAVFSKIAYLFGAGLNGAAKKSIPLAVKGNRMEPSGNRKGMQRRRSRSRAAAAAVLIAWLPSCQGGGPQPGPPAAPDIPLDAEVAAGRRTGSRRGRRRPQEPRGLDAPRNDLRGERAAAAGRGDLRDRDAARRGRSQSLVPPRPGARPDRGTGFRHRSAGPGRQPRYHLRSDRLGAAVSGGWKPETSREPDRDFRRARRLDPKDVAGTTGLARLALQRGEAGTAAALLESLTGRHSLEPYYHQLLGRAYLALGREQEAAAAFRRGEGGSMPRFDDPWERQADQYSAGFAGRRDRALAAFAEGRLPDAIEKLRGLLEGAAGRRRPELRPRRRLHEQRAAAGSGARARGRGRPEPGAQPAAGGVIRRLPPVRGPRASPCPRRAGGRAEPPRS